MHAGREKNTQNPSVLVWYVAWVVEWVPIMQEARCLESGGKVGWRFSVSQLQLHSEFEAILGHMRPSHKNKTSQSVLT